MSTPAFVGRRSIARLARGRPGGGSGDGAARRARAAASTTSTWHMDETSGSTMADSTGSHPGTLTKVGLGVAGDPAYPGTGYHFNGESRR